MSDEIEFVRVGEMTAAQLEDARKRCLPIHCQTMKRRSRVNPGTFVFSDVEELTREFLEEKVREYESKGWRRDGVYFIRQRKPS